MYYGKWWCQRTSQDTYEEWKAQIAKKQYILSLDADVLHEDCVDDLEDHIYLSLYSITQESAVSFDASSLCVPL